jgi:hypothetical protein
MFKSWPVLCYGIVLSGSETPILRIAHDCNLFARVFLMLLGLGSITGSNEEVSWSCVVMAVVCKGQ